MRGAPSPYARSRRHPVAPGCRYPAMVAANRDDHGGSGRSLLATVQRSVKLVNLGKPHKSQAATPTTSIGEFSLSFAFLTLSRGYGSGASARAGKYGERSKRWISAAKRGLADSFSIRYEDLTNAEPACAGLRINLDGSADRWDKFNVRSILREAPRPERRSVDRHPTESGP